MNQEEHSVRWSQIDLEIPIAVPRTRVWEALVNETSSWWPKGLYAGANPKGFHIEAKLGGRMFEDWGDGAGLLWYTVVALDPPDSLQLAGHVSEAFGGPATSQIRIALDDSEEGTILSLRDDLVGAVTNEALEKIRGGWRALFEKALKNYAEGREGS